VVISYDSWIFDWAKLQQDLTCGWFLRAAPSGCPHLLQALRDQVPAPAGVAGAPLVISQLLRVIRYTAEHSLQRLFLMEWIEKLWKS
jgi:hypothetical protein